MGGELHQLQVPAARGVGQRIVDGMHAVDKHTYGADAPFEGTDRTPMVGTGVAVHFVLVVGTAHQVDVATAVYIKVCGAKCCCGPRATRSASHNVARRVYQSPFQKMVFKQMAVVGVKGDEACGKPRR